MLRQISLPSVTACVSTVQVPETLIGALRELEAEYAKAMADPEFQAWHGVPLACLAQPLCQLRSRLTPTLSCLPQEQFAAILKDYVGRESPLYHAERLSEHYRK